MVKTTPLKSSSTKATLKQTIAELREDKIIADKLIYKMKQTMIEMDRKHALELKQTMIEMDRKHACVCDWCHAVLSAQRTGGSAKDAAMARGRAAHRQSQRYMAISARWFVIASARSDAS
jgi:hypothetical protein